MTKDHEYVSIKAKMRVEQLDQYFVVHMVYGADLKLMRQIRDDYRGKHLFACLDVKSRVNSIASHFGVLVQTVGDVNIYHLKGE